MTKKLLATLILFSSIVGIQSCANRKVTRIEPTETPDISGSWNNTDSKLTADAMIDQALTEKWLSNHVSVKSKKPVVIVGTIANKSHEHIEAETFVKDLERAFIKTQKVGLVQSGKKRDEMRAEKADMQSNASASTLKRFGLENGADYILQGSINSIVDAFKKKKTVTYQINLELTNIETNEIVWIGDKKIAKYVKN
jgi:penicillin-binding protein activator